MMFEVVPPSKFSSEEAMEKVVADLADGLSTVDCIDALNVPEVVDENRHGSPYYRNLDVCRFAEGLRKKTGLNVIANKVVVQCRGRQGFLDWLDSAVKVHGLTDFVFVGGNYADNIYPGPSVAEATEMALERFGLSVGGILIPSRLDESERLLRKTLSGTSFFTTQILFSANPLKSVLSSYYSKCVENSAKPAEVFLSFSVPSNAHHLEFMKWLGAELTPKVEETLLSGGSMAQKSIDLARSVWLDAFNYLQDSSVPIQLGLNVEAVFLRNLDAALEMARQLSAARARNRF